MTGKVSIRTNPDGISPTGTVVEIDGVKVPHLRTVKFEHEAGDIPKVWLLVLPRYVEIDGHAQFETHAGHSVVPVRVEWEPPSE